MTAGRTRAFRSGISSEQHLMWGFVTILVPRAPGKARCLTTGVGLL